ncbi:MAG TPA: VOC family protein [Acidimicrobiia bacterium]|nr:VOC family protein [Acidimicrobiia bacterium]
MTSTICANCEQSPGAIRLWSDRDLWICYECLDWMNDQRARQTAGRPQRQEVAGFDPIFSVADVGRAVEHYQRLGFQTRFHDDTYAFAQLGSLVIQLAQQADPPTSSALYIHVDDADRVANAWRSAGMNVVGPVDEEYGKREGRHVDPDGNLIRFGGPIRR